jgi:hypothetical protein
MDIRGLAVDSTVKFYLDDNEVIEKELTDGICGLIYNIDGLSQGSHELKIRLEQSESTKARIVKREFIIN